MLRGGGALIRILKVKRLEMRSLGAMMFSFKWTSHARATTAKKMPSEWCKEGGMSGQKILTNDLIKIFTTLK